MSYEGIVQNGVVVLPRRIKLTEGANVRVETLEMSPGVRAMLKLAKPRPHWPKDYALNHAHYVKGHPKKK